MTEFFREFFHMGGYGAFVWSAYGLAFVVLLMNLIQAGFCRRRVEKRLARNLSIADSHSRIERTS